MGEYNNRRRIWFDGRISLWASHFGSLAVAGELVLRSTVICPINESELTRRWRIEQQSVTLDKSICDCFGYSFGCACNCWYLGLLLDQKVVSSTPSRRRCFLRGTWRWNWTVSRQPLELVLLLYNTILAIKRDTLYAFLLFLLVLNTNSQ